MKYVALVSAVWGRVPLTRVWWLGVDRIRSTFAASGIDCQAFVSGSESAHSRLCHKHGGEWAEADNRYVGEKWNTAARRALAWGADYIFILGSDDFFAPALVDFYVSMVQQERPYVGLTSIHMYEPASRRAAYVDNAAKRGLATTRESDGRARSAVVSIRKKAKWHHHKNVTLGAGRLLAAHLFRGHEFFWEPTRNRSLDASMVEILDPPPPQTLKSVPEAFALDVKTTENIWSLDILLEWYPGALIDDYSYLKALPEWDAIQALDKTTQPGG